MQFVRSCVPVVFWLLAQVPAGLAQPLEKIFIEPRSRISVVAPPVMETAAHLRVDASLVLVPASVTTDFGGPVTDLLRENFRLFEDGAEHSITYFAVEDAPLSVGLIFDTS